MGLVPIWFRSAESDLFFPSALQMSHGTNKLLHGGKDGHLDRTLHSRVSQAQQFYLHRRVHRQKRDKRRAGKKRPPGKLVADNLHCSRWCIRDGQNGQTKTKTERKHFSRRLGTVFHLPVKDDILHGVRHEPTKVQQRAVPQTTSDRNSFALLCFAL